MKPLKTYISFLTFMVLLLGSVTSAQAVRIKDLASVHGVRGNQLIGYGLVVGLKGTGDKSDSTFTVQGLSNMLNRMGVRVRPDAIKVKNVAAVMVTAELPPFSRLGSRIDITLSSLGDCTSLGGGTLLITPLKGVDGEVYAIAQGPVSVGGFSAGGQGSSVTKNHPTVGRIPNGAIVEQEVNFKFEDLQSMTINLKSPDFTTADRMANAINRSLPQLKAKALDPSTVQVELPYGNSGNMVDFMARLENLDVIEDQIAKVVVEERTGTVVIGEAVRIKTVAVASGSLTINIVEEPQVSQALPFAPGGQTVVTPQTSVTVVEHKRSLGVINSSNTIGDVVRALNSLGATPRDLIVILQALKTAGALTAELEII